MDTNCIRGGRRARPGSVRPGASRAAHAARTAPQSPGVHAHARSVSPITEADVQSSEDETYGNLQLPGRLDQTLTRQAGYEGFESTDSSARSQATSEESSSVTEFVGLDCDDGIEWEWGEGQRSVSCERISEEDEDKDSCCEWREGQRAVSCERISEEDEDKDSCCEWREGQRAVSCERISEEDEDKDSCCEWREGQRAVSCERISEEDEDKDSCCEWREGQRAVSCERISEEDSCRARREDRGAVSCERISEEDENEVGDTTPSEGSCTEKGGEDISSRARDNEQGEPSTKDSIGERVEDSDSLPSDSYSVRWGLNELHQAPKVVISMNLSADPVPDQVETPSEGNTIEDNLTIEDTETSGSLLEEPTLEEHDEEEDEPDSDEERVKELGPLSCLEALAAGCALEEAVNQLSVLAHTARAANLSADLRVRTLDERLEAIDAKETDEKSFISQIPQSAEENARVDKIQRDRALVQEALRQQLQWLRLPPGSSPLRRLVRDEERRSRQESRLLAESVRGARWGQQVRAQVQAEGQHARHQLHALREERTQLQEEARSLRARAALGAAVTERWERARLQQHQRRLHVQEEGLHEQLREAHRQDCEELRVHAELVEYLRLTIEDLEVQSEEWQARYLEVTAESDEKLSALKARRTDHSRQLRAVRKELSRRDRFKREFYAYKDMRDQQANERIRRHDAATRIQSWWRMTMVRKGLGPYRRVAKKKKKKKK